MIHEVQGSQLVRQVSAFRLRSSNKASFRDSRYAREIPNREVGPKVGDLCLNAYHGTGRRLCFQGTRCRVTRVYSECLGKPRFRVAKTLGFRSQDK
jgi:hypothetical protein